jgi:hypothetical protein
MCLANAPRCAPLSFAITCAMGAVQSFIAARLHILTYTPPHAAYCCAYSRVGNTMPRAFSNTANAVHNCCALDIS